MISQFLISIKIKLAALGTGKVTVEEALKIDDIPRVKALETGKVTVEEALKFTNLVQIEDSQNEVLTSSIIDNAGENYNSSLAGLSSDCNHTSDDIYN